MRASAIIFALALGGCRSLLGIDDPVVGSDAPVDVPTDSAPIDAPECYGVAPFELCTKAPARTSFDVSGPTVILDTAVTCDAIVRGWCVIVANDILISGQLRVAGSRPLALLALNTMTISGTVSADANGSVAGPGAEASTCGTGVAASPGNAGGGGGAGGSFATKGGNGGTGGIDMNPGGLPAGIILVIDDLRGGCRGNAGAQGNGGSANPAGAGGGGVYLLSANTLAITGKVDAGGGGGGRGNSSKSGGSGGGSGGMIVLWSPAITGTPTLIANGGGGGGGADGTVDGFVGFESASTAAADGGPGGTPGAGRGGKGSSGAGPGLPGLNDITQAGGGGGGGGGGVIRIFGGNQLVNPMASPPPS